MNNVIKAFAFLDGNNVNFEPYVVRLDGEKFELAYHAQLNDKYSFLHIWADNGIIKDDLYIRYNEKEAICKRVIENVSGEIIRIKEAGITVRGIDFGCKKKDDYFYHNENPRIYETMTFPIDYIRTSDDASNSEFDVEAGNKWADPDTICDRIGASPYQPFPAILISNYNTKRGIVHGTLSQKLFYHNYLVSHDELGIKMEIFSSFKDIDALETEAGRVLIDEWYLGETNDADNLEKIFEGYTVHLRKRLSGAYGRSGVNRKNVVWGSWNDGICRNVNEELILKEAKYISENYPTVKWIQLDDGYSHCKKIAHGLGVPYEGDGGIDGKKFPEGLRAYSDKIRALGLRPALWIGGFCPHETQIYKEHPEWFIDYSYRTKNTSPLDISQPEVMEYMKNAMKKLCLEYGFDGVKHDFWSYAFEDSHNLYKNKTRSGYENRRRWLRVIRDCLPEDGYMQTGCDIVMGNPFLGEFFTNYRYGIDICDGIWENVKTTMQWGAACFATHTGDLFVPNSDSIGLLSGLSENESMFCINYCITTHSMVEIAGRLSEAEDKERIKVLKKAVCNPNNGQDVYFVGLNYRKSGRCLPEIMYFKTPHFSCEENNVCIPIRTVGVFNAYDESKTYRILPKDLGLKDGSYIITDVWSTESFTTDNGIEITLEPHCSRLLAVSENSGYRLLDANIRILSAEQNNNSIIIETDYDAKEVEFVFNNNLEKVMCGWENTEFSMQSGKVCISEMKKGRYIFYFTY